MSPHLVYKLNIEYLLLRNHDTSSMSPHLVLLDIEYLLLRNHDTSSGEIKKKKNKKMRAAGKAMKHVSKGSGDWGSSSDKGRGPSNKS